MLIICIHKGDASINRESSSFLYAKYELKMGQFRIQEQQLKSMDDKKDSNAIKCPTCNSTKVKRISGTAKVAGAVAFGLFSKTARSQFKCDNCGYKW